MSPKSVGYPALRCSVDGPGDRRDDFRDKDRGGPSGGPEYVPGRGRRRVEPPRSLGVPLP